MATRPRATAAEKLSTSCGATEATRTAGSAPSRSVRPLSQMRVYRKLLLLPRRSRGPRADRCVGFDDDEQDTVARSLSAGLVVGWPRDARASSIVIIVIIVSVCHSSSAVSIPKITTRGLIKPVGAGSRGGEATNRNLFSLRRCERKNGRMA